MGGSSNPLKKIPGVKNVVKIIDKVVPNELKPALPYVAMMIPGLQGTAGLFARMGIQNPLLQKALISGATRGLIDENASLKDIATTSALAVAPSVIKSGLGSLGEYLTPQTTEALKGTLETAGGASSIPMSQQIGQLATQAAESDLLTSLANPQGLMQTAKAIALPTSVELGADAVEAAKLAQQEYERQYQDFENFSGQQLADFNAGRRSAVLASMGRAGFGEDEINATLAQLGLRNGGRVGYKNAGIVSLTDQDSGVIYYDENGKPISKEKAMKLFEKQAEEENKANGGIIGLMGGGMPSMEMDYRGGGFIPVGVKERADDVPARLSKNEFVMTADAVRAAGGGSVNEGARRMYELMNNLEAKA